MSRLQNKVSPDLQAQIDQLRAQVKHAEDHGQFDTVHHTMLARLLAKSEPAEKEKDDGE
jgi:hypothetical protein